MAKKSSKANRGDQYREIIEKEGRKWDDCKVLSFAFKYQVETGYYGELYVYDYMCKNRPELAAQIRARNPHNRR